MVPFETILFFLPLLLVAIYSISLYMFLFVKGSPPIMCKLSTSHTDNILSRYVCLCRKIYVLSNKEITANNACI